MISRKVFDGLPETSTDRTIIGLFKARTNKFSDLFCQRGQIVYATKEYHSSFHSFHLEYASMNVIVNFGNDRETRRNFQNRPFSRGFTQQIKGWYDTVDRFDMKRKISF